MSLPTSTAMLRLIFFDCHNTTHNKCGDIPIPETGGLCVDDLVKFGNKLLEINTGKTIYLECGDKLTDSMIDSLCDGERLYLHDDIYYHKNGIIPDPISIVIVGPGAVGKSAITQRVIDNTFDPEGGYDPTIADFFEKAMKIDGNSCIVTILDTAGQEEFKALWEEFMREKHGYIMAYSISSQESFEGLNTFYDILLDVLDCEDSDMKPMVLCGNKADLPQHLHQINEDERNQLTRKWLAKEHYLASALTGFNVRNMVGCLIREIINDLYPVQHDQKSAAAIQRFPCCCIM